VVAASFLGIYVTTTGTFISMFIHVAAQSSQHYLLTIATVNVKAFLFHIFLHVGGLSTSAWSLATSGLDASFLSNADNAVLSIVTLNGQA
jgi:hypothetical protein